MIGFIPAIGSDIGTVSASWWRFECRKRQRLHVDFFRASQTIHIQSTD
jgi:hypothetical protein